MTSAGHSRELLSHSDEVVSLCESLFFSNVFLTSTCSSAYMTRSIT